MNQQLWKISFVTPKRAFARARFVGRGSDSYADNQNRLKSFWLAHSQTVIFAKYF
jgi:hypothetical protein